MKYIHYLYIGTLAFLTACNSTEELSTTVEHPNGAIELTAGIVEGGAQTVTRTGAEDNHASHLNLTNGTKLALRVSGTWKGHSPDAIEKTTTATVGAETGTDNKHNALSCSPVLYWDDYGSADPNNMPDVEGNGRAEGLTIYGVAVNGKTAAPIVTDYTALNWTLTSDQTSTNGTPPVDKDLLISNNVKAGTGDGTYKFDARASGKLLEFRHALSKITVNLKAGNGFPVDESTGAPTANKFVSVPTVTLSNKEGTTVSTDSWAYTTGNINVTSGAVTSLATPAMITMNPTATPTSTWTKTYEALVMPGSAFASDNAIVARINADGNIYYVTAEKIRAAIAALDGFNGSDPDAYKTKASYNYIINVTVNKTDIVVTATVTNWTNVTAAEVSPVINVNASWGNASGTAMSKDEFSLYLRTADTDYGTAVENYYREERRVKYESSTWVMKTMPSSTWETTPLYWPNHNTHYQFRGIWPCTGTETGSVSYPRIEKVDYVTGGAHDYHQVIKVQNEAYTVNHFPSDLQIARPNVATNATCTNNEPEHTTTNLYSGGICATEGSINLEFKYMMSQVEVNLSTTDGDDKVDLTNAVVQVINIYTAGDVDVDSRSVVPTGATSVYTLTPVAGNSNKRLNAIVPQTLTFSTAQATTNVRFRIETTSGDVYYADIAPIKKENTEDYIAKYVLGTPGTWYWESGYHYVYNLKLSKTKVNVTATLANWTTVNVNEDVWF